jgi:hypothetical protein
MGGPKLGYPLICPRIKREKESWPVDFRGHCPILHIQFACHNRGFTLETWDSMGYFPKMWGWFGEHDAWQSSTVSWSRSDMLFHVFWRR